jgi:predicted RNA-binding protein with TRAM domain
MPYVETMLDPHGRIPRRVPDNIMATSAVFKSPFIISLPFSGAWDAVASRTVPVPAEDPTDGESVVALFPGVSASIWHTLGGASTNVISEATPGAFEPALVTSRQVSSATTLADGWISHALRLGAVGVIPRLNVVGVPVYEMSILSTDVTPDSSVIMLFQERNNKFVIGGVNGIVRWYYDNGGSEDEPFALGQPFEVVVVPFTPTSDGAISVVGFSVQVIDATDNDNWFFSISGSGIVPSFSLLSRSACAYSVQNVRDLTNLDQTNSERTTALAGLITYMGSDLRNGGVISAARLPMGTTPTLAPEGDYYSYLARLPLYAEDFPLKNGAYSWWAPDDIQEYFFRPYLNAQSDDLMTTSSLWFAMKRDNPEQDLRLDVVHHLEVLTRSVQYASELGPVNPAFPQALLLAKTLPAVTENAAHLDFIRNAFSRIKKAAINPANWVKLLRDGVKFLEGS